MGKLDLYEKQMLAALDRQISLTNPDSRSMATSGRGSGVVGYNVQVAVDTEHYLIVAHEQAKAVFRTQTLEAVTDRGYFGSPEILACHEAAIVHRGDHGPSIELRNGSNSEMPISFC
jgi:hypothetical protein